MPQSLRRRLHRGCVRHCRPRSRGTARRARHRPRGASPGRSGGSHECPGLLAEDRISSSRVFQRRAGSRSAVLTPARSSRSASPVKDNRSSVPGRNRGHRLIRVRGRSDHDAHRVLNACAGLDRTGAGDSQGCGSPQRSWRYCAGSSCRGRRLARPADAGMAEPAGIAEARFVRDRRDRRRRLPRQELRVLARTRSRMELKRSPGLGQLPTQSPFGDVELRRGGRHDQRRAEVPVQQRLDGTTISGRVAPTVRRRRHASTATARVGSRRVAMGSARDQAGKTTQSAAAPNVTGQPKTSCSRRRCRESCAASTHQSPRPLRSWDGWLNAAPR
ncbi:hypothetical protein SAMN05216188_110121 [Lentzea xinjiangensis]|uniref:Uncharacterized protein n=1 Tax=Lentzea xinjiangensis TaxID=402600 RepID=A0A1H9NBC8_9PSEU|nr:hypothetical protein SAMN05216188_110121 [Lentzea xinjiangensis]